MIIHILSFIICLIIRFTTTSLPQKPLMIIMVIRNHDNDNDDDDKDEHLNAVCLFVFLASQGALEVIEVTYSLTNH